MYLFMSKVNPDISHGRTVRGMMFFIELPAEHLTERDSFAFVVDYFS